MLEDMLLRAGVPYRIYGGTRFFDREEIRDLMAYLKLIVNPADDIAAKRIINKPRRGIGKTSVTHIEQLAATEQCSFMDAAELSLASEELSRAALRALGEFVQLLKDLQTLSGSLRAIVEIVAERSGIMDYLASLPPDEAISRRENVQEFFGVAAEFSIEHYRAEEAAENELASEGDTTAGESEAGEAAVGEPAAGQEAAEAPAGEEPPPVMTETSASTILIAFMEWLALRSDLDTMMEGEAYVKLMTVHSAKGLEFKVVFIAGMEEGVFPHMMSISNGRGIEEERRLAYVAITRARELLYLTSAQQRSLFGSSSANPVSRFTLEIPAALLKRIGLGSLGIRGTGWEKRGSRKGIYGSGTGGSSGRFYGSDAEGSSGRLYGGRDGAGPGRDASTAASPASPSSLPKDEVCFAPGDSVEHKVFGRGSVLSVNGNTIAVQFEEQDKTRKLLVGLAPLAKINS
jgi:DNA helicase-2/ATP-dependent DNA helicase PcrA